MTPNKQTTDQTPAEILRAIGYAMEFVNESDALSFCRMNAATLRWIADIMEREIACAKLEGRVEEIRAFHALSNN